MSRATTTASPTLPKHDPYPANLVKCPGCHGLALDGHLTCGNVACDEAGRRYAADLAAAAAYDLDFGENDSNGTA